MKSGRTSKRVRSVGRSQERLFLKREYAEILGKRKVVFWTLYSIMLLSLAAVAIGRTGLAHLKEQMEDPFTGLVDIPIGLSVGKKYPQVQRYLDSCATNQAFQAAISSGSYIGSVNIWSRNERQWTYARTQSFGFWNDDELLMAILDKQNLIEGWGRSKTIQSYDFEDGVIVSQPLLKKAGIDVEELRDGKLLLQYGTWSFPVTVIAVVRTLPAKSDIYLEHALFRGIREGVDDGVLRSDENELSVLLSVPKGMGNTQLHEHADHMAEQVGGGLKTVVQDSVFATHDHRAVISLVHAPNINDLPRIQERLDNIKELRNLGAMVRYGTRYDAPDPSLHYGVWAVDGSDEKDAFSKLSITFQPTDSIIPFQHDLARRFDIQLDLASVQSKKNFAVVSNLSHFLVIALIVFATAAILLFLYNLLKNHLERIKMNLGTFMAFGLSERFLLQGYLRIVMRLLVRVMALAMFTLLLIEGCTRILDLSGVSLWPLLAGFDVATNLWLYLTLLILQGAAFVIFRWQLRGFLANTPGDLIYARK